MQSEQINELAKALVAVQAVLPAVKKAKTGQVGSQKTKYADLDACVDVLKKVLPEHGLAYVQPPMACDNGVMIRTVLMHTSGQWIDGELHLPADKNSAQAYGSALTYCRRYALCAITGLVADDDDDAAAASRPRQTKADAAVQVQRAGPERMPTEKEFADGSKAIFAMAGDIWGKASEPEFYAWLKREGWPVDDAKGRPSLKARSYPELTRIYSSLKRLAPERAS